MRHDRSYFSVDIKLLHKYSVKGFVLSLYSRAHHNTIHIKHQWKSTLAVLIVLFTYWTIEMEQHIEFLTLRKNEGCYMDGYVYIRNKYYTNQDGCTTEYFNCQHKYAHHYHYLCNYESNNKKRPLVFKELILI